MKKALSPGSASVFFAVLIIFLSIVPARTCYAVETQESASALNRTRVMQAVQEAVNKHQSLKRHRVSSITVTEDSTTITPAGYQSLWNVVVRYWLNFRDPDEVPYMKGMLRHYDEMKDLASGSWIKWASALISRKSQEFQEQISFPQESKERLLASAQVDETGKVVPSTIELYYMVGSQIAVPVQNLMDAEPTDQASEQAGYGSLGARDEAAPDASGQPQPLPQVQGLPETQVLLPSEQPLSGDLYSSPDRNRAIALTGSGLLAVLIAAAIINQRLQAHRRRPLGVDAATAGHAGNAADADQDARLRRIRDAVSKHYSQYGDGPGRGGKPKSG